MIAIFLACQPSTNTIVCAAKLCEEDDTATIVTGVSDLSEPSFDYEPIDTGIWPQDQWVDLVAGGWHSCILDQQKKTHCWGRNNEGQLEAPDQEFRALAAGHHFTCGLGLDSFVSCWGDVPINMPENQRFLSIKAGRDFVCGISESKRLHCWGAFEQGQTEPPDFEGELVDYELGNAHACLLNSSGQVQCWGRSTEGQVDVPEDLMAETFVDLDVGYYHSCGLTTEQRVYCWGTDYEGSIDAPPVLANALWTGYHHNCALNPLQQAICWGGQSYGLSGGLVGDTFVKLALGGFHTCGVTTEQELRCYGSDEQGQLDPFPSESSDTAQEQL